MSQLCLIMAAMMMLVASAAVEVSDVAEGKVSSVFESDQELMEVAEHKRRPYRPVVRQSVRYVQRPVQMRPGKKHG